MDASQLLRSMKKLAEHLKLARKRSVVTWVGPEILKLQFLLRGIRSVYRKGLAPELLCQELASDAKALAEEAKKEPEIEDSPTVDTQTDNKGKEERVVKKEPSRATHNENKVGGQGRAGRGGGPAGRGGGGR